MQGENGKRPGASTVMTAGGGEQGPRVDGKGDVGWEVCDEGSGRGGERCVRRKFGLVDWGLGRCTCAEPQGRGVWEGPWWWGRPPVRQGGLRGMAPV